MVDEHAIAPADVQATFCATLVDEWIRLGVVHAVISPGSRSTPLALALAARGEIRIHVVHDERSAGFVALGLGLPPGEGVAPTPALLVCTSGTAAANHLPAVVEAGLSEVPMIVLTADRPPELRGVGAPQTIDQVGLHGSHVRWSVDAGVPRLDGAGRWRSLAARARSEAEGGPVHLNLAFREPLIGVPLDLPRPDRGHRARRATASSDPVPEGIAVERGLILVGGGHAVRAADVVALAEATGWPIAADPLSGVRGIADVVTLDALVRVEAFASAHRPEVVVRIGRPSSSKVVAALTAADDLTLIQVSGPGRIDPARNVAAVCSLDDLLSATLGGAAGETWRTRWRDADATARAAIDEALGSFPGLTEPTVARVVADHVGPEALVTVSSSMPVRDLEWFGGPRARAHANRGANGIDGVVSTALGRTLLDTHGSSTGVVLIGDLAFVHDSNALVALAARGVDLRIVVVDNDGGGIFSFLPQATELEPSRFERLFGTPLGCDVVGLARAHRIETDEVATVDALVARLALPGPWVCRVATDRARNVEHHDAIHRAVERALAPG
ncbi:2-succinyl-5-enolpyruvyl-6-hydroxy-3-cyclohexene-1-carboxylic-acid synthase [Ilumatobacter sp.]|uniref:2-succinyl-5-enolpyruvyl-6-hydroxy-3- cyclohexene-1-carboxylic-acid synthase n=1 Tax=Ilumatobacter sp. TaxID=1967498 RepID=UPI003B52424C